MPILHDYLLSPWEQARGFLTEELRSIRSQLGRISQTFLVGTVPFSGLPKAPALGSLITVTDSVTTTWGTTIAGGGTNQVLAYFNGSNWTVAGK